MFVPARPLPPLKELALRCLSRGPVTGGRGAGWLSYCGRHHFNTHTVNWIVSVGWARFSPAKTDARITPDGRGFLSRQDDAA